MDILLRIEVAIVLLRSAKLLVTFRSLLESKLLEMAV